MHFGTGKVRDVLCRAWTARSDTLDRHDKRDRRATRTTRVYGRRHSVDSNGHGHLTFSEVVPETDANPQHKRLNFVHASTTGSSSSAMLEEARHDTYDKRETLITTLATRTTRHATTRHVTNDTLS